MNWKVKAKIQSVISAFPDSISYEMYYRLQRALGGLRKVSPCKDFLSAIELVKQLNRLDRSWVDKTFLEIGTGRRLNIPIALWLMGANKVITVDLNPYLKEALVREDIHYIINNKDEIAGILGDYLKVERYVALVESFYKDWNFNKLIELCEIHYVSPVDASKLPFDEKTIDYHVSNNVLEHIPSNILVLILKEAKRIIKNDGLLVHRIDFSDHFSHSDKSISSINFLQFNDQVWEKIAGNRYMYMNRLRLDDISALFEVSGQKILSIDSEIDLRSQGLLVSKSIWLDERFKEKSLDVLSTTASWIISS
jgi:SAM-dependent methyltransferase